MKLMKLASIMFFIIIIFSACQKNENNLSIDNFEPIKSKQVVVMEQTGTWCSACPGGAATLRSLVEEFEDDIIPIAVHGGSSDPMKPSCYSNFRNDRSYSSFPSFYITESRIGSNLNNTKNAVSNKLTESIQAAIAFRKTDEGDSISIKTKTKFYENLTGSYYLSIYVTEDSIYGGSGSGNYKQSGISGDYYHEHVLRETSKSGNFWGEEIIVDPEENRMIENNFKIAKDPNWVEKNLKYSAVLWRYEGSSNFKYTYINAIGKAS